MRTDLASKKAKCPITMRTDSAKKDHYVSSQALTELANVR
jgi:hypothetical protein